MFALALFRCLISFYRQMDNNSFVFQLKIWYTGIDSSIFFCQHQLKQAEVYENCSMDDDFLILHEWNN